jgi:tRNA threonylcarbamoyladenosine biosynthesis protein TsaE
MIAAEFDLPDAATTTALGAELAQALVAARATRPLSIYLHGELGAGKTTLAQGLLRALGVSGTIRSPSYTLVEPYETALGQVLHVDLYRLQGARDVEALGLPDELADSALLVVEWPERAAGMLPAADLSLWLTHQDLGRHCRLEAAADPGAGCIVRLRASFSR